MRKLLLVLLLALSAASAAPAAKKLNLEALRAVTDRFLFAMEIGTPGTAGHRFLYSDNLNHIHVYAIKDGELDMAWETTNLGSRTSSMFVTDLYAEGRDKLVVSTVGGRVVIYDMDSYDLEWENLQDRFSTVTYMTHANLDDDKQEEVVILADKLLYIYDSINKNVQWVSTQEFTARQIVIGNIDDDPQLEIIFNTGRIIDSRFYNIQLESDTPFGDRISLVDINQDGYPEIFGEYSDFTLRVYDVWNEREIW